MTNSNYVLGPGTGKRISPYTCYSRFSVVTSVREALGAGTGGVGLGGIISSPVQKRQTPYSMSFALVRVLDVVRVSGRRV
jgi:hypothetical protein